MNIDSKTIQQEEPTKCHSCKSFYGSEANKGLCSSCFKKTQSEEKNSVEVDNLRKESVDTQADFNSHLEQKLEEIPEPIVKIQQKKEEIKPVEEAPKQVDKKRCFCCKKKIGLLGIECKCGFVYCSTHRLPEQHSCEFDHRKVANDRLKQQLVKVYNGKIAGI